MKRKFKLLLRAFVRLINFSYSKKIGAVKYSIPVRSGVGPALRMTSEIWMLDVMKKYQPDGTVFLDIGANIGQTLLKFRSISSADYIAFEPNPICSSYLETLCRHNNIPAIQIIPCGVSKSNGFAELLYFTESLDDTCASIISEFRDQKITRSSFVAVIDGVEVSRLLNGRTIGLLKIDVEGAEVEVLEAMEVLIGLDRPVILLEVLPCYSLDNSVRVERQKKIENLCVRLSYEIYRVKKDKDDQLIGEEAIDSFGVHSDLSQCDYILKPN